MNKILALILLSIFFSPCLHAENSQSSVPPQSRYDLIKNRLLEDNTHVYSNQEQSINDDFYVEIVDLDFQQNELIFNEQHHISTGKQQRYDDFSLLAERNYQLDKLNSNKVEELKPVKSSNTFISESAQLNYSPWGWGWGYGAQWGGWPYYPHRWYY